MAGSVKGLVIQIGGDTTKLQDSLKKVNTEIKNLSKDLRETENLLKFDHASVDIYRQKQGLVVDQTQALKNKLTELKNAQKLADKSISEGAEIDVANYRALEREIEKTRQQLNQLQVENTSFYTGGKKLEEFGDKLTKVSDKLVNIGTTLTTTVSVPLVGVGALAVKSAADFESAWTGVLKTVDGTNEQLDNLRSGIIKLSEEIPSSAAEIANVAEVAGQLGIATDDVLNFTKVMIDLGNSTNLNAEEAASALAKFANITNMSASDYQRLGSTIVDLGNNFATTESEIVEMTTRLAATGELAGLSQSQMLALATSMSSVGIEAEAGGTAMSKLLQKLQVVVETGSESLGDFAKVAGMSSKEFKKAWEEDALNATYKFISGLKDTERNGKSAIAILQDMEIKEARLSNTILSLANSSEMFGQSIELANNAWENNTALTEEANKRYSTFQSRLDIVKNKAQNLAVEFGEKLIPHVEKLMNKLTDLVEWFGNLSDEEQENIIKIAAFVAAIGPALVIIGKLGTTLGTVSKGIGVLSQSLTILTKGGTATTASTKACTTAISALTNPIVLATAAIIGLGGAYLYLASKQNEAQKYARKINDEVNNSAKTYSEYNKSIDSTTSNELQHISRLQTLKNELSGIVDENGKVKEGYENRANYIVNELNNALGTELKLNDGIVESYKEVQKEIDNLIEKKKAEIIVEGQTEKWKNAFEGQQDAIVQQNNAYHALEDIAKEYGITVDQVSDKINDLNNRIANFKDTTAQGFSKYSNLVNERDRLQDIINAYSTATELVKSQTEEIQKYESVMEMYSSNDYEGVLKATQGMKESVTDFTNYAIEEVTKMVNEESKQYEDYYRTYMSTNNQMSKERAEMHQQNLNALADELAKRTATIGILGIDEITAWQNLASKSYDAYVEGLSQLPEETSKLVQQVTGVFITQTPEFEKVVSDLGNNIIEGFDKSEETKQKALETIQAYINGLNDNEKRELLKSAGIQDADIVLNELNKGNLSEENGRNILNGLYNGLNNKTMQNNLIAKATSIATSINNAFTKIWDIHSPSKYMQKLMNYYLEPIGTTFEKQELPLSNKAYQFASSINDSMGEGLELIASDGLSAQLDSTLMQPNKQYNISMTINPQKLTDAELNNAFNYVNKKLGTIGG